MIERFARPYADALFSAAGSTATVTPTRAELSRFADVIAATPALRRMVANPGIPGEAKRATVREIATRLGLGPLASRFVETLLGNQRLVRLPSVLEAVDELLDRKLGILRANITSASELSENQRSRLKQLLESSLGSRVELEVSVEPELLGGFVAQVGSERYDVSLRGELDRMADHLAGSADGTAAV